MVELYKFQPDLERLKLMVEIKHLFINEENYLEHHQTNKKTNKQRNTKSFQKQKHKWSQALYFRISESLMNLIYFHIFPLPKRINQINLHK